MQMSKLAGDPSNIRALTSSPLRNRIRLELEASASEVWALIGNFAKLPEYSSGLERVDTKLDSAGNCAEFVCHFKPMEPNGERIVSREIVRWWEPNRGYASSSAGGDVFGMSDDLNLVLIEPSPRGILVTMEEYYQARDLSMMKTHFDEAFTDIGANLVRRFGGRVVERYVES
jgi:hypothetical protein